ncbi:hypothetical protein [Terasakiella pusilla]
MTWKDLIPFVGFERLSVDLWGNPTDVETDCEKWFLTIAWFGAGVSIGLH